MTSGAGMNQLPEVNAKSYFFKFGVQSTMTVS